MRLDSRVRQACREAFRERRLLERILPDIDRLLQTPDEPDGVDYDGDPAAPGPWGGDEVSQDEGVTDGRDDS